MDVKKLVLSLGICLLVAACGSSVKLDDVPVEDRSGSAVKPIANPGPAIAGTAVDKNAVASVDLSASSQNALPLSSRTVYFDYDSFVIKAEFQGIVESQARFIKADRNRRVAIEGHTDERGGREYNLALGQKRAESLMRALALLGVPDTQMEAVSFGKEKPAVMGSDENAMSKNRRAEITYR
jgi:peptidoglycan-associated lipoprotein